MPRDAVGVSALEAGLDDYGGYSDDADVVVVADADVDGGVAVGVDEDVGDGVASVVFASVVAVVSVANSHEAADVG